MWAENFVAGLTLGYGGHICHGKINFLLDKILFIHDKINFFHDKILSIHDKILFDP